MRETGMRAEGSTITLFLTTENTEVTENVELNVNGRDIPCLRRLPVRVRTQTGVPRRGRQASGH